MPPSKLGAVLCGKVFVEQHPDIAERGELLTSGMTIGRGKGCDQFGAGKGSTPTPALDTRIVSQVEGGVESEAQSAEGPDARGERSATRAAISGERNRVSSLTV